MSAVTADPSMPADPMTGGVHHAFREVAPGRLAEWLGRGHQQRHFFPHTVRHLPKCGPDGFRLAQWMCGADDPGAMWELVLYAHPTMLGEFPPELFFDDDVVWHQQQFGRPGQVATASLVVERDTVYSLTHVSDLVQRISRRREHKTRVEKRFKGWSHMLLNAVIGFARERGARRLRIPTARLALRHTDVARNPKPELFERIYDHTVVAMCGARRIGEWWEVDVAAGGERAIASARGHETRPRPRTVCICHDVERGLGHLKEDPALARWAGTAAPRWLEAMRDVEADAGVQATYCVVGALLDEVRGGLEDRGHSLAFHSYDHRLDGAEQLHRCREVDYRLKGYRPPRSTITPELSERNLLFHNFEWLASSTTSLGSTAPRLRGGLVRIPIACDDFPLYTGACDYAEWERQVLALVTRQEFTAIGLHDCYAPLWLDRYPHFLRRLEGMAELRTLDEVAAETTLAGAA